MADRWFIDAWCPPDGLAFASRREPNSLEAEETIFISPPYFEPERIASIATALGATRGHFQTGFVGEEGEIPFSSLEDIIETVRRTYRGGGSDLTPSGAVPLAPVVPPEEGAEAIEPERLVSPQIQESWDHLRHIISCPKHDIEELEAALAKFIDRSATNPEGSGPGLLCKFALASIASPIAALAGGDYPTERAFETVTSWAAILARIGLFLQLDAKQKSAAVTDGSGQGFEYRISDLDRLDERVLEALALSTLFARLADSRPAMLRQVLFRIPCPERWLPLTDEAKVAYPAIPTLGSLVCVATADRIFLQSLSSPLHMIPIAFIALAIVAPSRASTMPLRLPSMGGSDGWSDLNRKTASWLSRALPVKPLNSAQAERYVHLFTKRRLEESLDRYRPENRRSSSR